MRSEFGGYRFGSLDKLTLEQQTELARLVERPAEGLSETPLAGRTATVGHPVPGLGRVFVKRYARGGLLGKIISDLHWRTVPTRPEQEFRMLMQVRSLGVSAPKPVALLERGDKLYRAWLAMEELENSESLVTLSLKDEDRVHTLFDKVSEQLEILVANRILHVDFHPGNVVITPDDKVYFVDFDKAYVANLSVMQLRDLYLRRWRRAVIKHQLPHFLNELISSNLRLAETPAL